MKRKFRIISLVFLCLTFLFCFSSCHKTAGAICNDGHRSYSTGRGTCSWHGGVDHYINTNEISIPNTVGLVVLGLLIGGIFINIDKKS